VREVELIPCPKRAKEQEAVKILLLQILLMKDKNRKLLIQYGMKEMNFSV